jgi:uncharacterized protein DUF2779
MNKRQVLEGMLCARRLWWTYHEPGARELMPGEVTLDRFAEGRAVGRAAQDALPGREYEVSFEADGVAVRVDVLERREGGVAIIEVKAAKSVDAEHLDDLAIQVHVLRAAGIPVVAAELMHLDPECRAPDLSNLLKRVDVTAKVERRLPLVAEAIREARQTILGHRPDTPIGAYCGRGKEDQCPFIERCWSSVPDHHVSTLYYIGKKWPALAERGHHVIGDLPEDVALPREETRRQVRAIKAGARIVEEGLAEALGAWRRPLAFLDFETVSSAIPYYAGSSAWEQVPAQWSVHHEDGRSAAWIADREADPRPALAAALVDACRGAETIVAYYAEFERGCLRHLQAAVPALAADLEALERKLVDALPIVRNYVYDPAFGGRFSLKAVQPALTPELSGYGGLAVHEGQTASVRLKRLLGGEPSDPAERAQVRDELLRYCEFDTFGLMKLVERLRELSARQP